MSGTRGGCWHRECFVLFGTNAPLWCVGEELGGEGKGLGHVHTFVLLYPGSVSYTNTKSMKRGAHMRNWITTQRSWVSIKAMRRRDNIVFCYSATLGPLSLAEVGKLVGK